MKSTVDYQQLVEVAGDAIIVCDPGGVITLWNPASEFMFGFSQDEAVGQSLDLIIPERLRARHWEGYRKTMETGQTRYGHDVLRVPGLHKDGHAMSISFTVALLYSHDKKITGIASVIRNETAKFNEDRALRKRLAELEARLGGQA
jgi:PAS domain S-box-containing protein